jgi:hypothetical protein
LSRWISLSCMYPFRTPLLWLKLRMASNLNWSTKKIKNQTWTESGRNPKLSVSMLKEPDLEDFTTLSLLVVSFNLSTATGRRWLLRQRVSSTAAVPNSWNLVLQNPQLWILYALSFETYALIPVVRKITST